MKHLPFNRPLVFESGYRYLREAVANMHLSGDGPFTRKCHLLLEQLTGAHKALLTTSCTHALEMAALLLDIQPGDEVIVPSFTFVSTVNAFVLRGARPVFADIRPDTLNLDETRLNELISSRTRAVVPVHYAGVGCEMDMILRVAEQYDLSVVEDNAHGLTGSYQGRPLGSFGRLATLSFHETKNFTCGEGGALLLNDPSLVDRAEIIREKGTNRNRYFRGQIDKYTWVDVGSSYLPSEVLAALLFSQLEASEAIQAGRLALWDRYHTELADWASENTVRLPVVPSDCAHPAHLYYLLLPSLAERQSLIAHLREHHITSVFHYQPLHLSDMGLRLGGRPGDCPVTEDVSDRLLRLPLFNGMLPAEQDHVIATVCKYRVRSNRPMPTFDIDDKRKRTAA